MDGHSLPIDINVVAAIPIPTEQDLPIAAGETEGTLTIAGEFLKDIKEVFAIDKQRQRVQGLTFKRQGESTDSSSEWKVTVKDTLDRTTEKTYKLRLRYSEQFLTLENTNLTVKVAKKPAAGDGGNTGGSNPGNNG